MAQLSVSVDVNFGYWKFQSDSAILINIMFRSSHSQIFSKIGALRNWQQSQKNTMCWSSLLTKLQS